MAEAPPSELDRSNHQEHHHHGKDRHHVAPFDVLPFLHDSVRSSIARFRKRLRRAGPHRARLLIVKFRIVRSFGSRV